MINTFFVSWLISTLIFLAAAYAYRSIRLKRLAKYGDLHWPGIIVLSLLIGLVPAMAYKNAAMKNISVPEGVGQNPVIIDKKD